MRTLVRFHESDERRRGGVLVMALLAVLVVSGLGAAFLQLNLSSTRQLGLGLDNKRAFYLAESGLAEAYWGLLTGRSGVVGSPEAPAGFGHGMFWVEATEVADDLVQLESTGLYGRGRAALGLVVRREVTSAGGPVGLVVSESLTLGNSCLVDGYDSRLGPYEDQADLTLAPPHTGGGGLVMSNMDISLGSNASVWGDARPGMAGSVSLGKDAAVSGSTAPMEAPILLPPVEVPPLTLPGTDLSHRGATPLIVPPGEGAYGIIDIGKDAEVRIQGPQTLVLDSLELHSGARVTLDTTGGAIEIFVRRELILNSGAAIGSVEEDPTRLTIQIAAKNKNSKKSSVQLNAGTNLFANVYAPEATVTVSNGFALFGALACKALAMGSDSAFHFDNAFLGGDDGDAPAGPRIVNWRVVEIPDSVPAGVTNPFTAMGLTEADLVPPDEAHAGLYVQVKWIDPFGVKQSFEGWEDDLDWSVVDGPLDSFKAWADPSKGKVLFVK